MDIRRRKKNKTILFVIEIKLKTHKKKKKCLNQRKFLKNSFKIFFSLLSATVVPKPVNKKEIPTTSTSNNKKKIKKAKKNLEPSTSKKSSDELDSERLKAYGVSTKKLKRLLFNKKQDAINFKKQNLKK